MPRRPVPSDAPTDPRAPARVVVLAAALDAACILGFAAAGRSSHAHDGGLAGVLGTAWPFLAAVAVGWLATRVWRAPLRVRPTGVVVWAVAWLGGLALRAATGGGTAPAFVVVAALVLGVLLLGWRAVATTLVPVLIRALIRPVRRRRPVGSVPGR